MIVGLFWEEAGVGEAVKGHAEGALPGHGGTRVSVMVGGGAGAQELHL